jgi:polar amino acid transport system substrate-binding protein
MLFVMNWRSCLLRVVTVVGLLALTACAEFDATRSNAQSYANSVASASSTAPASTEVRQTLAPTGVLRVGVYLGSPTSWVRLPQTGESAGIAFELGQTLAKQLVVPVRVVEYPRVAEVIEGLKTGEVDMTFTNASAARAQVVDFTPALIQLELGVLVSANSRIKKFDDVDQSGVRVGVSQGSSSQAALGQRLKNTQVTPVASLDVVQKMLRDGQLDAFATNKGILFELAEKLNGFQVLSDRWGFENLAIAVPKGREAGLPFLQNFAHQVKQTGALQQMVQRAGLRGVAN